MQIWAHTLVRNEERYLWFSVMSVIDYVDKMLIWDTGSTDNTVQIIREIKKRYPEKVDFKKIGIVDPDKFTDIRQGMLNMTKSDWFIIVDGDEVWWNDSIKEIVDLINKDGNSLDSVVSKYYNIVGDIYHYQEERAGRYEIDGRIGHLNIRAMNRGIPGLKFKLPHGQQGIFDEADTLVQNRDKEKRKFLEEYAYLHFTHMNRSSSSEENLKVMKRNIKMKYELGIRFPYDFYYPEVFFIPRPYFVPSPWVKMTSDYYIKALVETPIRKFKRRLIRTTSGY